MARSMPCGWGELRTGATVEMIAPGCDWAVMADDEGTAWVEHAVPIDEEGDPCWLSGLAPDGWLFVRTVH